MKSFHFEISEEKLSAQQILHEEKMEQLLSSAAHRSARKIVRIISLKIENRIMASAQVTLCFNYLVLDSIWVDESIQRQGFGVRLYQEIEDLAQNNNCQKILLQTFDFLDALPFWTRMGFKQIGLVQDCPPGHQLIYFEKNLPPKIS